MKPTNLFLLFAPREKKTVLNHARPREESFARLNCQMAAIRLYNERLTSVLRTRGREKVGRCGEPLKLALFLLICGYSQRKVRWLCISLTEAAA